MGRRKEPLELKQSKGTLRIHRDGDPKNAPKVVAVTGCPQPPDSLGEHGRDAWLAELPRVVAAGYFSESDLRAFETYCRTFDEVHKCDLTLQAEGEHYSVGDSGAVAQHPAVNQRFKWLEIRRRYEDAFWLNPTARSGKQVQKQSAGVRRRERA